MIHPKVEASTTASRSREALRHRRASQEILLEDLPWINLFIANQYEAMRADVKGYVHIPTGSNIAFRETWLDR